MWIGVSWARPRGLPRARRRGLAQAYPPWRDDPVRVGLGDRPVHLLPLSNEVPAFPPGERVY